MNNNKLYETALLPLDPNPPERTPGEDVGLLAEVEVDTVALVVAGTGAVTLGELYL